MADAREEQVWTDHAQEHSGLEAYPPNYFTALTAKVNEVLLGGSRVLDLGCGSALWRHTFDGFNYVGADQNAAMISVAERRFPDCRFEVCNGMDLPFQEGSFDLVFTAAVLQHNKHNDKALVVENIVRVLQPGGYYMFTEGTLHPDNYHVAFPDPVPEFNEDITDGYSFTRSGWETYLPQFGLAPVWFDAPSNYLFIKE